MNKDYRNTEYCSVLDKVADKKSGLEELIRKERPRAKIMYNQVNKKDYIYFTQFSEIYNRKCAYCGASMQFTDIKLFEVDHFICESSFGKDTTDKARAGVVSNLVFACYICNRGKKDILIEGDYRIKLNPDDSSISAVFYRDEDYYIKIHSNYEEDHIINDFYDRLKLGYQTRRLDYLLMEMQGLLSKISDKTLKYELESAIARLMKKKNCTTC